MEELDLRLLGSNIKLLRKKVGISQIHLAAKIDVSQTHMSNIENGNSGISLSMAHKIAQVLDCTIDELISGVQQERYDSKEVPLSVCTLGDFVEAMKICIKDSLKETKNHHL